MGIAKILAVTVVLLTLAACAERVCEWWRARRQVGEASQAPTDYWQVHPLTRFALTASKDGLTVDPVPTPTEKPTHRSVLFAGGVLKIGQRQASDGGEVHFDIRLDDDVAAYAVTVNGKSLL